MKLNITRRSAFILITLLTLTSVGYSIYAQIYQHQQPCPLCIVQRTLITSIGILALIFTIHNPRGLLGRFYGLVIVVLSGFTIKIASHHLWLINLPKEQQPLSCGMPLNLMFKRLPLGKFLNNILQGDAECGDVTWTILSFNPPTMVIGLSLVLLLVGIYAMLSKR
jgi:disulfide bond formation protein DsbB